jgi:hypothetical protein
MAEATDRYGFDTTDIADPPGSDGPPGYGSDGGGKHLRGRVSRFASGNLVLGHPAVSAAAIARR